MRVIQERDANNTPTVSYTRGRDLSAPLPGGAGGGLEGAGGIGGLLGRSHGYASTHGNWYTHNFYHADGNGNVTYLLKSSQTKVAEYRYDPYGNTISSSGSLAAANVYRFSSKEIHVNSGMYYYGFRFYDPNLQRWLNRDPIDEDGGINLCGFVSNDSIDKVDPFGFQVSNPPAPPKPPSPPKPAPPTAPPCPNFQSQWPALAGAGGKVGGAMGKCITCLDGLRQCMQGCETEYGAASTLPESESKPCMSRCKADCRAKAAACAGLPSKPGPKSGPVPAPKMVNLE